MSRCSEPKLECLEKLRRKAVLADSVTIELSPCVEQRMAGAERFTMVRLGSSRRASTAVWSDEKTLETPRCGGRYRQTQCLFLVRHAACLVSRGENKMVPT